MPTPKGYFSQSKDDRSKPEHVTVSRGGPFKIGMDVRDLGTVHEVIQDAAEAGSTTQVINATAHVALAGDRIRFVTGVAATLEADVQSVTANTITLDQTLPSAPGAGDTFSILRQTSLTVSSAGGISTTLTPIQFRRDGGAQEVVEDTVTPANNRPLPVKITGLDGDVVINSSNLNLEVQLDHDSANPDSVQIGDGTEIALVTAAGQLETIDTTGNAILTTIDADTGALAGTVSGSELQVDVVAPLPAGTNNIGDVDVVSSALPTGAATEATLSTVAGDTTSLDAKVPAQGAAVIAASLPVNIASDQVVPISATALPLPTGAATEATLASIDAGIGAKDVVDLLDTPFFDGTTINGSAGAFVTAVASLAAAVTKIQVIDTTGQFIGVYTGPAASEVLKFVYGPGSDQTIEVQIASATRISFRSMESAGPTSGNVSMNFLG